LRLQHRFLFILRIGLTLDRARGQGGDRARISARRHCIGDPVCFLLERIAGWPDVQLGLKPEFFSGLARRASAGWPGPAATGAGALQDRRRGAGHGGRGH
jgi:hypothetical protein